MTVQYSTQSVVSDGTLSTIVLGIKYILRSNIYMRIDGVDTPQTGASSGYTWTFLNANTIRVLPVIPRGITVELYRRTDITGIYNVFSQNAQFDEGAVDENNAQLLYIAQEYLEQDLTGVGIESLEYVRSEPGYEIYRFQRSDGSYLPEFPVPTNTAALATAVAALAARMSVVEGKIATLEQRKSTCLVNAVGTGAPHETVVAQLPANIAINSRYVLTNPFGSNVPVECWAEIFTNNRWARTGFMHGSHGGSSGGYGTTASYVQGEGVVVQTGGNAVLTTSSNTGSGHDITAVIMSAPCRVFVRKLEA